MIFADTDFYDSEDGSHSLFSKKYGYTYHSKFGAVQESQHIFIDAALRFKAVVQEKISVLDIGFGTGLNAYLTYLEALKRNLSIQYVAVEAYPIAIENALQLNYPEFLVSDKQDTNIFQKLHTSEWNTLQKLHKQFHFEKKLLHIENIEAANQFDIIYYDAFAPDVQPELWEEDTLQKMYNALKKDGILTTYCAKGQVRRNLKAVGFSIEKIPGPRGKREITRAFKNE